MIAGACRHFAVVVTQAYDLPLFIPLWWAARDDSRSTTGNDGLREVRS
jgi:hypothetical protein